MYGQELDVLYQVIDKHVLDPNSVFLVDENGGVTIFMTMEQRHLRRKTDINGLGIDDVISSGNDISVEELTDNLLTKMHDTIFPEPVHYTFGLIIRSNNQYIVDNVIARRELAGQRIFTRDYETQGGDYKKLLLPIVQSSSDNKYDPCQCNGAEYIFLGSIDGHTVIGCLEIPVPSALPEGTKVNVEICYDFRANLRVRMKIPAYEIDAKLEIDFG